MSTDLGIILRLWDFDMDSAVLGPVRCAHLDVSEKFAEFEERIRSGTVESTELARNIFQSVAHRRTGDSETDAKCGGAMFSEEDVATVSLDDLDIFCDKIMNGRLMFVATDPARTESGDTPFTPKSGRDGLAPALLQVGDADRAAWKRMAEAAKKSMGSASHLAAQFNAGQLKALAGDDALARAMRENRQIEDIVRGLRGTDELVKSVLGEPSMNTAAKAMADIRSGESMLKTAMAADNLIRSASGQTAHSAAIEAVTGVRPVKEAETAARFATRPDIQDRSGIEGPAVAWPATEPYREMVAYRISPNPIHQTNKKFDEILAHQKSEAAKKDLDRSESKVDSGVSKEISRSGLRHTKVSTWAAVVFGVIALAWSMWVYFSSQAAALESDKKWAMEIERLHAEIRALKPNKAAPDAPAAQPGALKPSNPVTKPK
jgi:hypothetical protein